jgi:hypothetical protein
MAEVSGAQLKVNNGHRENHHERQLLGLTAAKEITALNRSLANARNWPQGTGQTAIWPALCDRRDLAVEDVGSNIGRSASGQSAMRIVQLKPLSANSYESL